MTVSNNESKLRPKSTLRWGISDVIITQIQTNQAWTALRWGFFQRSALGSSVQRLRNKRQKSREGESSVHWPPLFIGNLTSRKSPSYQAHSRTHHHQEGGELRCIHGHLHKLKMNKETKKKKKKKLQILLSQKEKGESYQEKAGNLSSKMSIEDDHIMWFSVCRNQPSFYWNK